MVNGHEGPQNAPIFEVRLVAWSSHTIHVESLAQEVPGLNNDPKWLNRFKFFEDTCMPTEIIV